VTSNWAYEIIIHPRNEPLNYREIMDSLEDGDQGWFDSFHTINIKEDFGFLKGEGTFSGKFDPKSHHDDIVQRVHMVCPTSKVITRWKPMETFTEEFTDGG